MAGFIKLYRSYLDHWSYQNINVKLVWIHLLLRARWRPGKVQIGRQIVHLDSGQLITGRKKLSKELGISEETSKCALKLLERDQQITIKSTNKYSLISIVNWGEYQAQEVADNQQTTQQITSKQPADAQQMPTIEEREEREEGKEKDPPQPPAALVGFDSAWIKIRVYGPPGRQRKAESMTKWKSAIKAGLKPDEILDWYESSHVDGREPQFIPAFHTVAKLDNIKDWKTSANPAKPKLDRATAISRVAHYRRINYPQLLELAKKLIAEHDITEEDLLEHEKKRNGSAYSYPSRT